MQSAITPCFNSSLTIARPLYLMTTVWPENLRMYGSASTRMAAFSSGVKTITVSSISEAGCRRSDVRPLSSIIFRPSDMLALSLAFDFLPLKQMLDVPSAPMMLAIPAQQRGRSSVGRMPEHIGCIKLIQQFLLFPTSDFLLLTSVMCGSWR